MSAATHIAIAAIRQGAPIVRTDDGFATRINVGGLRCICHVGGGAQPPFVFASAVRVSRERRS